MSNLSLNNWRQVEQLFGCRSVRFQVSLCSYCFRSSYQHLITGQQFPKMLRSGISCHHQYVECKPVHARLSFGPQSCMPYISISSLIASLVQSRNHSSTLSPANRMMACRPWFRPGRSLASLRTSLNSAWENTSDWCWTIQHFISEAVLIPSQMINPIMNARRKKSNSEEWPWEWGDCLNLVNKLVLELFMTAMLKLGMPWHTPWMEESMLSLTSFAQTHWAISFRTTKA